MLNLAALGGVFGAEQTGKQTFKILDTSVIIGRPASADIAETGSWTHHRDFPSSCSGNCNWSPTPPTR